jgi:hypothetical protein
MKREEWEDEDIDLEDMPELEGTSSANEDISGYSDQYFGRTGYGAEMEEEVNKRGYPLGAYDIFGTQGYGREMEREVEKRRKANTPPPDFKQLGFNALQKENIHTGEHLRIESPYRIYPVREMTAEEKLKRKRELRRARYLKSKKKKENQVGGARRSRRKTTRKPTRRSRSTRNKRSTRRRIR